MESNPFPITLILPCTIYRSSVLWRPNTLPRVRPEVASYEHTICRVPLTMRRVEMLLLVQVIGITFTMSMLFLLTLFTLAEFGRAGFGRHGEL